MSYSETLDYLYQLQWHGIQPGLKRMSMLLSLLGHPERSYRSIHIGGTNGKGSTSAIIAALLGKAGFRVGLYTSPHLIHFSERISLSDVPICEGEIIRLTALIREAVDATPGLSEGITFFEFTTAMALLYFSLMRVDFAVVEVGMGGRYDATNLLAPEVSAITNIGLDHEQYLGGSLLQIAKEKAGIIKAQTPIVTAATQFEVCELFKETARLKHAPLFRLGHEIKTFGEDPSRFLYRGIRERTVACPLMGRHQIDNSAVALGVIEQLQQRGVALSEADILEGMKEVRWPGRLEIVRRDPLIILDGAHNPAGARALASFLTGLDPDRRGKHWLMIGVMRDKNIRKILEPITPWADEIVLTRPDIERAADPHLMSAFVEGDTSVQTVREGVPDAMRYVASLIQTQDSLVITGSLYTVGEAKAFYSGVAASPIRG